MEYLKSCGCRGRIFGLTIVLLGALVLSGAEAQTLTTLGSFNLTNGQYSLAGLVADANGNLFGTTAFGGSSDNGTVFEVPYSATTGSYATTLTTLVSFNTADGAIPYAGLITDASGNLFGTTVLGGTSGNGTVFEVPYNGTTGSYSATATPLVSFNSANGLAPLAGLIAGANGNLFGTTELGGASGYGTVFEVPYNATTGSYAAAPTTLVSFNLANGAIPSSVLVTDASGNLFGTTEYGGTSGRGTVFEVPYNATTGSYATTPTTLVSFNTADGAIPYAGLVADASGNLFGTTKYGGASGYGTVFEVPYDATTGSYATVPTTLVSFNLTGGAYPTAGLIVDANGNLFGTTEYGGASGYGTVFEVPNDATTGSYATVPTTLVSFNLTGGAYPTASLIADANGNLFGTTQEGGSSAISGGNGWGTVFEITGSGFVTSTRFAGTPGTTNCGGVSTSTLVHTYGGLAHAAAGLHFTSVAALESAISSYCNQ